MDPGLEGRAYQMLMQVNMGFNIIYAVLFLTLYLIFITRWQHSQKHVPNVNNIAQMLPLGHAQTFCCVLPTIPVHFYKLGNAGSIPYLPIIRGAATPFLATQRTLTTASTHLRAIYKISGGIPWLLVQNDYSQMLGIFLALTVGYYYCMNHILVSSTN